MPGIGAGLGAPNIPVTGGADRQDPSTMGRTMNPGFSLSGTGEAPPPPPDATDPEQAANQKVQDALTSLLTPKNTMAADMAQLSEIAGKMRPSPAQDMARMGFAMAAGTSPFFAANVGQGGLAMLNAQQEQYKNYAQAMTEVAKLKEYERASQASEAIQATNALTNEQFRLQGYMPRGAVQLMKGKEALLEERMRSIDNPQNPEFMTDTDGSQRKATRDQIQQQMDQLQYMMSGGMGGYNPYGGGMGGVGIGGAPPTAPGSLSAPPPQ